MGDAALGCSDSRTLFELQKLQNRAARILTNSAFDAPSSPSLKNLGWMKVSDLISFESNQLVSKSLKNQAPQYICNLFQRNSDCSSRDLRNTATDLRLPMFTSLNGKKVFPTAEPRYGITLQLVFNRHPPFQFLNKCFS